MHQPKVLVIQDISASCRISMNVAVPILSCLNNEVNMLPTALLSTHTTSGFTDYTYLDLTDESKRILTHWKELGLMFDGILVGYLGSINQIKLMEKIVHDFLKPNGQFILDPVMGDNGSLYSGFDGEYVSEMKVLSSMASVLLPNVTEASLLINSPEVANSEAAIQSTLKKVANINKQKVIMTGISTEEDYLGAMSFDYEDGTSHCELAPYYKGQFEGGGDLFSSVVAGFMLGGKSVHEAMAIAVNYVNKVIKRTAQLDNDNRRYGLQFETDIPYLLNQLNRN